MAEIIRVAGKDIFIDLAEHLKRYDVWEADKWSDDKLICASPIREERHPSFFVNLSGEYAGTWLDSGTDESGNFQALIALLEETTIHTAVDMLLEEYYIKPYEAPSIMPSLAVKQGRTILTENTGVFSDYLMSRGISKEAQEAYGTSEFMAKDAVMFPYIDGNGLIRALKYRNVSRKDFWYQAGNNRIKDLLFGQHLITELKPNTLWICEAEIDAMTVFSYGGYVAVSLGSANISEQQLAVIKKAGFKNIVTACDNDSVGQKANNRIAKALGDTSTIIEVNYKACKDINEYTTAFGELPELHVKSSPKVLAPILKGIRKTFK